ncbi:MAG: heavy-metal-associated domain-containing protein [Clostridia bacterium]|nr:heavy-metal-associated domain-containing protein [Clostridia bacterium]
MNSFKVPDMMCMHCVNSINAALQAVATDVNIDLATKTVSFNGDINAVKAAIEDIGFEVE